MSSYIPTAINEKAYEQAQKDALATYAPQGVVLGSGFLAGFLSVWLPAVIVFPLLYLYKLTAGADSWMSGSEKHAAAMQQFITSFGAYARVAIWAGLALGLYGILQAWLRQRSNLTNKFTVFELARYGELRLGTDAKITILGVPVAIIVTFMITGQLLALVWAIFLVVLSGFFYNIYWGRLDNLFLGLFFHPSFDERAALALRLMVPRHVGWQKARLSKVEVNRETKTVRVEGEFESDMCERETREIIGHFMRGYHPIYVVNTKKVAS